MNILYVVNSTRYFVQHRLSLATRLQAEGHRVAVAAPPDDSVAARQIEASGCALHPFPLDKRSLSPLKELRTFLCLAFLLIKARPDLVHSLTIKSVIYSGLLCRVLRIKMVALIPGLGIVFSSRTGLKAWFLRTLATFLYRQALACRSFKIIFENEEDRALFVGRRILHKSQAFRFMGSGVDVDHFPFQPYDRRKSANERTCIMTGRMLKDKGVGEYIGAAKRLKRIYPGMKFLLVGDPDPGNPSSYTKSSLLDACGSSVRYLGYRRDIKELLMQADIFCLPSYYPEGVPVSILEAKSSGLPVVTTDMPGCRDAVLHQETGLIVPARSVSGLQEALLRLVENPDYCDSLSRKARDRVEKVFAKDRIHARYLDLYKAMTQQPG